MSELINKKKIPLLVTKVNGKEICHIHKVDLPCEKLPGLKLSSGGTIEFTDSNGVNRTHSLGDESGWFHFSIRVNKDHGCQPDCAITQESTFDPAAISKGEGTGIRFQPFFITGAKKDNKIFIGKGLFKRGLHYHGTITHGSVMLSCMCDYCYKSFHIKSFHSGFSNVGYFYSTSGAYTITVSDTIPGCPAALTIPDPHELAELEAKLPKAPDGTEYKYTNPFRCSHCKKPYIDFERHPDERQAEYYGNYHVGSTLIYYEPNHE